jgi:DNA-directed RNA polymerase specialized sigma24 family protein
VGWRAAPSRVTIRRVHRSTVLPGLGPVTNPDPLARSFDGLPDARTSLDLLARAQGGDRHALEDLVRRYQDRLHRIVSIQLGASPLRRHYDSLDIVQRTFTAAVPKIGDLRPRSAAGLLQWLAIIATNQIRDAHDHEHAAKRDAARQRDLNTDPANRSRSLPPRGRWRNKANRSNEPYPRRRNCD